MLLTKQQIINYLTTSNFAATYVCEDGTLCKNFSHITLPENVFGQTSMGPGLPARHWWVEYLSEDNKFVLHCSYFAADNTPITREQFAAAMKESPNWTVERVDNLPAVLYTSDVIIQWVPTGEGEWTVAYNTPTRTSGWIMAGALSKILLKPIEYVCGGTIADGIAGFVYGKYVDGNGGYYYTKLSNNPQPPCCSELQLENCGGTYPETGICVQSGCCIDNISIC